MKKVLSILLSILLLATLVVGCQSGGESSAGPQSSEGTSSAGSEGSSSAEGEKLLIGVAYQDFQNEFTTYIQEGVQEMAAQLGNVELVEVDGQGKAENQISQVENFIAQGVDGIILNPYDADGCAPAVTAAADAGIPIVVVNAKTSNVEEATAYVGSNDVEAGEMEMKFIAEQLGGKGTIVIMSGLYGNSAQIQRQEGIDKVLAEYPDITVYAEQSGNWVRDEGMTLMENWLQGGEKIDAVVAHNDQMALGALGAIEAANLDYDILTIGIDAIPDAVNSVANGGMTATILQDGPGQGSMALETLVKAIHGEEVEKETMIPFQLCTIDNVADFQ